MITIYGRRTQDTLVTTTYGRLTADTLVAPIYGHVEADYVTHFDGYINVPSALMMREDEIKKWTDATINLGRTYKINYY